MADRKILDQINLDTKAFKTRMKEQLGVLGKLKDMGDTLQELTGGDDPMQETIKVTLSAVEGIVKVVESLEKLEMPEA